MNRKNYILFFYWVLPFSILLFSLLFGTVFFQFWAEGNIYLSVFVVFATFAIAINGVISAFYRIYGRLARSILVVKTLEYAVYLAVIGTISCFSSLSENSFGVASGISLSFVSCLSFFLLTKNHPVGDNNNEIRVGPIIKRSLFSYMALAMAANISAIGLKFVDILTLGLIGVPEDIGVYAVANRYSEFMAFGGALVSIYYTKRIGELVSSGSFCALKKLAFESVLLSSFIFLILAVVFFLVKPAFISILGEGYESAFGFIFILAVGKFLCQSWGR